MPLDDEHVDAVPSEGGCGGQTGRSGADDENVAGLALHGRLLR